MKVDFLIIGQGLAGSLLGFELIHRGFKVFIIDSGQENASQVAAGLINPVTGMRFVKSADVDNLLPVAKTYYRKLENLFQQIFYVEKPMLRLLKNEKEIQNAQKRLNNSDYFAYLGSITRHKQFGSVLEQQQTGYLLTQTLLKALQNFFINHQSYQQNLIDYQAIQLSDTVIYQQLEAKQLIFCEGYHVCHNPWFRDLPFQPVKGEILTLEHRQCLPNFLLNYGHWMIPLDDYHFRTGATFDRENINTEITDHGKQEVLNALQKVLPNTVNAKLTKQQANVRPCTLDKQPFIGLHPQHQQLAIFNGFGAKGSLQIPYYCQQFVDFLSQKKPLPVICDILRYRNHLN